MTPWKKKGPTSTLPTPPVVYPVSQLWRVQRCSHPLAGSIRTSLSRLFWPFQVVKTGFYFFKLCPWHSCQLHVKRWWLHSVRVATLSELSLCQSCHSVTWLVWGIIAWGSMYLDWLLGQMSANIPCWSEPLEDKLNTTAPDEAPLFSPDSASTWHWLAVLWSLVPAHIRTSLVIGSLCSDP